ncbi:LOB domain-containing protein 29-like [Dioscorea cayenensis subsp. rotundata]|uniref:LOB domain-containing protein 29-like n=1 Tax=Dioscorea cayennensis subsp. rotundata TaxID=55577 RepID=A0AB40AZC3_DIOCR|nr:LOB domain-containing protein 29-like [Dioscorea cayenensis subsp. rotundata]
MTCIGSPCGACKFLRRKCVRGCVFAPYFCHEQGATHFAAIHKVFGASNVSKLLTHLPVQDRCEAAITIAYEAQARLQDPIYGCVAHIFALQQQVINLQAQLAVVKEQAAQRFVNGSSSQQDGQWYYQNSSINAAETMSAYENGLMTSINGFQSSTQDDNKHLCGIHQENNGTPSNLDMEDLQSIAFGCLFH